MDIEKFKKICDYKFYGVMDDLEERYMDDPEKRYNGCTDIEKVIDVMKRTDWVWSGTDCTQARNHKMLIRSLYNNCVQHIIDNEDSDGCESASGGWTVKIDIYNYKETEDPQSIYVRVMFYIVDVRSSDGACSFNKNTCYSCPAFDGCLEKSTHESE